MVLLLLEEKLKRLRQVLMKISEANLGGSESA